MPCVHEDMAPHRHHATPATLRATGALNELGFRPNTLIEMRRWAMDSGNERSGAEPSRGTMSSTLEWQAEASEHWSMRWRRTNGELSSLERLELFGWDEV